MLSRRGMTAFAVALFVVVAGGLAAVFIAWALSADGEDATPVSVKALQLAAGNTESAESMRFELRITGAVDVVASGVVSGDGTMGNVQMDLGRLGRAEERIVDGTVYLRRTDAPGGSDGTWFAIPLDRLPPLGGSSTFRGAGETPKSSLALLEDVAGPVEVVGDDTIAGRHATHHRANLTKDGSTVPIDVWIDDADRVVKVHATEPGNGTEITMEITAFGVPVDVQAPPADQVTQLPDLAGEPSGAVI